MADTWYGNVLEALTKNPGLLDYARSSNETVSQVNALLLQVQRDPSSASQVSTQIIAMKGIPSVVRDMASNLPQAARDPSGVALVGLVSQMQSALPRSRWF